MGKKYARIAKELLKGADRAKGWLTAAFKAVRFLYGDHGRREAFLSNGPVCPKTDTQRPVKLVMTKATFKVCDKTVYNKFFHKCADFTQCREDTV